MSRDIRRFNLLYERLESALERGTQCQGKLLS